MPDTLDFSVVIVSWNVSKLLRDCLDSIFCLPLTEQPKQVFVVDNASNDDTVEMVREKYPSVSLIVNSANRGFAAANNQAIEKIATGAVLLLNPDTKVYLGTFPRMLRAFADHPKAGIIGPKLLNQDGSYQPSVRNLPSVCALTVIALKLRYVFPKLPVLKKYLATDLKTDKEQVVGQVMGAAFLIRREVIKSVGLLDEKFHVWFEEVDYCKRAANAGWGTWYIPEAVVTHVGGQSFAQQPSIQKQYRWHKSVIRYSRKHFGLFGTLVLLIVGWLGLGFVWAATRLRNK